MNVQWKQKWMSFCHKGKEVRPQGLQAQRAQCLPISGDQYYAMQNHDNIWCVVQLYAMDVDGQLKKAPLQPQI